MRTVRRQSIQRSSRGSSCNNEHCWLWVLTWILLLCNSLTLAKTVSGQFRLSGVNSEHTLVKFAVSSFARGRFHYHLQADEAYPNEQSLRIHVFRDDLWKEVQKTPSCEGKVKYAYQTFTVRFEHADAPLLLQPKQAKRNSLNTPQKIWKSDGIQPLDQPAAPRPYYFYVVIDDCMLEQYYQDNLVPVIKYRIDVYNDVAGNTSSSESPEQKKILLTHLSSDEVHLPSLHTATLILSTLICVLLLVQIGCLLASSGSVHMAILLVVAASVCDAMSSLCELIHLKYYESNGVGWYALDAMASHFEAICDSIISILLLSIAAGWTLPSDVIPVPQNATFVQSLLNGLRNPVGALAKRSVAGILSVVIVAVHVILAQWGRTYDDDFDTYHSFEHLPGRILMWFRMLLGVLLVAATIQTRSTCTASSLLGFYSQLAIVGTVWFQSLPFVAFCCSRMVPYYLRHPAVTFWSAIAQSSSLVALAWLVTSHSTRFHSLSHMTQERQSLTDSIAASTTSPMMNVPSNGSSSSSMSSRPPRVWNVGKAKVRLD